jgi:hypothetical protein
MDPTTFKLNPAAKEFVPVVKVNVKVPTQKDFDRCYWEQRKKEMAEQDQIIAKHLAAHPEADPKNPWGWSEDGPYADMH